MPGAVLITGNAAAKVKQKRKTHLGMMIHDQSFTISKNYLFAFLNWHTCEIIFTEEKTTVYMGKEENRWFENKNVLL